MKNIVLLGFMGTGKTAVARLLGEDQTMPALGGRKVPAAPEAAQPSITFNDRLNLSFNGS